MLAIHSLISAVFQTQATDFKADASFEFLSDINKVHYGSNTWQKSLEENEKAVCTEKQHQTLGIREDLVP